MSKELNPPDQARAMHDVGGLALGPIDLHEHPRTYYEMRVDALVQVLVKPAAAAFKVDALRRTIECYSATEYENLSYYDRWLGALCTLLVEQEVLTRSEIDD
ncbi:MAG: uncharacterized protein JWQ00_2443, partial [Noviherbaspirillum sp.]|nr:uncharacterized protein [Noviherbaspirillum sp.]